MMVNEIDGVHTWMLRLSLSLVGRKSLGLSDGIILFWVDNINFGAKSGQVNKAKGYE